MIKLIAFAAMLPLLVLNSAFAQYATGTERYDLACGKNGYVCLQPDALKGLVGKKLTYKHTRSEFVAVELTLNADGSADMKNAKGGAGSASWEIVGEKINVKSENWGKTTFVIVDFGGNLLIAPGAGANIPMLLPLVVE